MAILSHQKKISTTKIIHLLQFSDATCTNPNSCVISVTVLYRITQIQMRCVIPKRVYYFAQQQLQLSAKLG